MLLSPVPWFGLRVVVPGIFPLSIPRTMPASVYRHKQPNKPGRPTLLTKEREAILLSAIEEGLPLKQAAHIAGICYETLNRWRIRGENESAPPEFRQFCQSLERSHAIAMQAHVSCIRKAALGGDWRASAWTLERRFPEEFTKPQQIEHSGPGGKPMMAIPDGEYEVLTRMRKQAGIKDLVGKLGTILAEQKKRQQEEAAILKSPFAMNTKSAGKARAPLRE